jgi:hypothetical protein
MFSSGSEVGTRPFSVVLICLSKFDGREGTPGDMVVLAILQPNTT